MEINLYNQRNMKLIRTIYTLGLLVGLFASCSKESPLDGEQYYKQVYIVGAYEVVQQFDVAYGDGPQNAYVPLLREVARISTGMWKSS